MRAITRRRIAADRAVSRTDSEATRDVDQEAAEGLVYAAAAATAAAADEFLRGGGNRRAGRVVELSVRAHVPSRVPSPPQPLHESYCSLFDLSFPPSRVPSPPQPLHESYCSLFHYVGSAVHLTR
jgi:hypothetical protein